MLFFYNLGSYDTYEYDKSIAAGPEGKRMYG